MDNIKTHELKAWPDNFDAMLCGRKTFETRINDREFKVGEYLTLKEWDPDKKEYTGRSMARQIKYILDGGQFGIEKEYVIMSIA